MGDNAKLAAQIAFHIATAALASVFLAGCDFGFEENLVPLEIPTAPPQGFQDSMPEADDVVPIEEATQQPTTGFGPLNSEHAISLCAGNQFFGDDKVGSCLAPGGEGYYVWVDGDDVMLVERANPHLEAFQISSLARKISRSTLLSKVANWPKLVPFLVGIGGTAVTCGSTVGAIVSVAGAPISPATAIGCVGSLATVGVTFDSLARDAQAAVEALIDSHQRESDAKYEFCRMEGGSDEQCTN